MDRYELVLDWVDRGLMTMVEGVEFLSLLRAHEKGWTFWPFYALTRQADGSFRPTDFPRELH